MARYVITGANRGIGLEFCRQLAGRQEEVVGVCRNSSNELDAIDVRVETGIDVTDEAAVAELARRLDRIRIDVLIHNAGILQRVDLETLDFESMRRQFEVNSLGPLRITEALLPKMARGGKIAILTSLMGSIADNGSGGSYGYRMSKAALNAAGASLAIDLRARGIAVAILHPGMVRTDMTGQRGIPVGDAVRGLLQRIDGLSPENSGTFWHADGRVLPW